MEKYTAPDGTLREPEVCAAVVAVLTKARLLPFKEKLLREGCDDLATLRMLSDKQLFHLGLGMGHRARLAAALKLK